MVEDALATARNEVVLYGREDERYDLHLGGKRVYMGTGGAAIKVLDLAGQVRESRLEDVAQLAKLCDALDNIHFFLRPVVARDLSNETLDINTYYAAVTNTTKHVTGNCFTVTSVNEVIEMCSLLAGSEAALREKPFVSFITSNTVSPLRFAAETVEVMTEIVRRGLPVFTSSAPQAGATSPAALAGTLVQINAEELATLVYCNLVNPGAPVILGYVPSVADLRTGSFSGGAPEFALMNAASAQLAQFYKLPIYNSAGLSDAKLPDVQAGYEKGFTNFAAALAGSNYVHHSAGMLESLLAVAYEQYVIDDDINGAVMRCVRGIEVTDETLSVEVIEEVCFGAGHYLGSQQALSFMKTEYLYPHTADRLGRDAWTEAGAWDMREKARQEAKRILSEHKPRRIDAELDDAIRERFDIVLPKELAGRS